MERGAHLLARVGVKGGFRHDVIASSGQLRIVESGLAGGRRGNDLF
jgi:hypothetical protein